MASPDHMRDPARATDAPGRILPGIVVGLTAEARIARRTGWRVEVGGGTPSGAAMAAERLIAKGVSGLVSFGLAGGLSPLLAAGQIIVPSSVVVEGQVLSTDPALADRLGGLSGHVLLAGPGVVATVAAKQVAHVVSAADAIDLESGAVALAASRHGLPFAVLRAICDPAHRELPPAALVALDGGGAIGLVRVLVSVLSHPSQIPALLQLARDAAGARRALLGRVSQIGRAEHGQ